MSIPSFDYNLKPGAEQREKACQFAIKAHGNQMYGTKLYVESHLPEVEEVLIEFGHDIFILRAAAWLHDILEDTKVGQEELNKEFIGQICSIVECVTSEQGANRKERNSKTYLKIRQNLDAIILKLADRIANWRNTVKTNNIGLFNMYKKEYIEFKEALFVSGSDANEMWSELDRINGIEL